MRTLIRPVALTLTILSSPLLAAPADTATLRELVAQPGYQQAWSKAVQTARLPSWARTFHGPATPVSEVDFEGKRYTVGWVCKPHDCANHFMYGAFSGDGTKAWALRVSVEERPEAARTPSRYARYQWIGAPDQTIRNLLVTELKKNPNWQ